MIDTTMDTTARIAELSDTAYHAFCEGISSMFGVEVRCDRQQVSVEAARGLQDSFKKLAVVHPVAAEGAVNGTFHLVFDQAGLFVLSGIVIMLPEGRILEQVKRGSMENMGSLQDAAKEVGNLLVGSWDTTFREQCKGHGHFVKKASIIGKLWEKPGQMDLSPDDRIHLVLYEMTVEPYPSFTCAAVFPESVLTGVENAGEKQIREAPKQEEPASEPQQSTSVPQNSEAGGDGKKESLDAAHAPDAGSPPQPLEDRTNDATPVAVRTTAPAASPELPGGPKPPAIRDNAPTAGVDLPGRTPEEPASRTTTATRTRPSPSPNGELADLLRTPAAKIMDRDVVWAGPDDTVQSVLAKMQQHNTGYVLIGQNGTLEGVVSNSSILGAVSLYLRPVFAKWRRPEDDATLGVKVKWIMSRPVRTIRPDTTLDGMIESMRRYGGRCLPVVDDKGTVQGIVTTFNILLHVLQGDQSVSWMGKAPQAPALLL